MVIRCSLLSKVFTKCQKGPWTWTDNLDKTLIDASKEVDVEVNAEKTICCCLVTRIQGKIMI
jgi:hypothetical protein